MMRSQAHKYVFLEPPLLKCATNFPKMSHIRASENVTLIYFCDIFVRYHPMFPILGRNTYNRNFEKKHTPPSTCRFYRAMLRAAWLCDSMSSVCPSVSPSVTFRYVFHTVWNTAKIISRPNSLRYLLTLTPTSAIWFNGN